MSREVRVSGIRRLLNLPTSGRRIQREVDDEIRFHLESRVAELVAAGTPVGTAREIATREFGDVIEARAELTRVDQRRVTRERRQSWWETFSQDLAYSARSLRQQPAFAAIVVVVLALGIGANVTMFGVIDRLLLRSPEHVADPARLMSVSFGQIADGVDQTQSTLSLPIYRDLRSDTVAFEQVATYAATDMAIGRGRDAREIHGMRVSANYFTTLGARPAAGRFFLPDEDGNPVAPTVIVLGYDFWRNRFEGNKSAIGQTLLIGDDAYTVIGVAPEGFTGVTSDPVDVWVPITAGETAEQVKKWFTSRQSYWIQVVGRLRPGVTPERATASATAILRAGDVRAGILSSAEADKERVWLVSVLPREARAGSADAKVAVLLGAVSVLVLLIACANVANLQLARGIARRREIAVRIALGIDRARLVRQLVLEAVLLALAAGMAAIIVTVWGGAIVRRVILTSDLGAGRPLDLRLVAYTAIAAVAAGILSGLVPAIQSSRPDVADTLRAGSRGGGPGRSRLRGVLLIVQAALTVVFLAGTVMFVRSLEQVRKLPLGIDTDHVLVVSARTSGLRITDAETDALYRRLESAARGAPGVASAAIGVSLPFGSAWAEEVKVPGRDSLPYTRAGGPYFNSVGPDFFQTVGTRILRGRGFTSADRGTGARVVVVNETLAKLWWPNEDPIGRCMKVGGDTMPCAQIIGIAENSRRFSLIEDPAVQFFTPLDQRPLWVTSRVLFVRPTGDPVKSVEALRRELQSRVPDAPYIVVEPLAARVNPQTRAWRLGTTMFGAFGVLAVIVAALGLYSVLAYDVSRRIRELGIRVALGAGRGDIGRMVMGRAIRVATIGALIGFAITISAGPAVGPLLFQTSARDPLAFALAAAVLFSVAMLAAVVPTRRAVRVDPIIALRAE